MTTMEAKIAKVTEFFERLGGTGCTSDARKALGALAGKHVDHSDYVLKEMMRRGLLVKLDFDTYRLASHGHVPPDAVAQAKRDASPPRRTRRGVGSY